MTQKLDALNIDRIVFIGRTYFEYLRMFGLDESDLRKGAILDCAAGPSSFTAEAHEKGLCARACDPLYGLARETLFAKGQADIAHTFEKLDAVTHLYVWKYYQNAEEIIAFRHQALGRFIEDFPRGSREDRYLAAELPHLPFPDGTFGLVLASHFLFLYGDRLSPEFHATAIRELVRVSSGEVRIFPLQGLDARPYPHLEQVLQGLGAGVEADIVAVPFEFQKGSNKMLRLRQN